jgi:2-methylcitrate dehydratase PrpD
MARPHLLRLGEWIARCTFASLPPATVAAARLQLLDMVAAVHAAARSREPRAVAAAVPAFAGAGRATVLATGSRLGPADAALANCIHSMAQDFDDIVWMGHTCHSAVFGALAVAEHEGRDARELLAAIVAGNEIGGRLGASCFLGPLNGQMQTFLHLACAAAAAARLLRLDAERTAHALAISLAQPVFALQPGFMNPTSKLLAASTPTATGVQAAYFARAGMTGALDILEDRRGLWRRFAYLPLPFMLDGLGEMWTTQTLTVKTYPGCHFFQTSCSAIEQLLARTGRLAPGDVEAVDVEITKLGAEVSRFGAEYAAATGPITPVAVSFDVATTVAVQLHAGRLTGAEIEPGWLAAETAAIRRWRERVRVSHDPALTARVLAAGRAVGSGRKALALLSPRNLYTLARRYREDYASTLITPRELYGWLKLALRPPRSLPAPGPGEPVPLFFPARVTLTLTGGRRESAEVDLPVGSFAAPRAAAELEGKFRRELGVTVGPLRAGVAWDAGMALPETPLARFVELSCCAAPGSGRGATHREGTA